MKNHISNIIYGILIGAGMILPGVSGSVIAVILGVYDNVIFLLNDKSLRIFNKFIKLFPLIIGLLLGVTIFGNILLILFENYSFQTMYVFIGLILGEIPVLLREVNKKTGKDINLKWFFITLVLSFLLTYLPEKLSFNNYIAASSAPLYLLIAGFLYISGKIIPGISSSLFLMILGLYDYILNIISNPLSLSFNEIIYLIPFIIGVLVGLIILVKIINYLLKNKFLQTYSSIIGFVLGSVFVIYPGFEFTIRGITSILLMIISFILIVKMSKKY